MSNARSRFEEVSRRAFLKRTLAASALVLAPGLACGNNDAEVLKAGAASTSAAGTGATASTAAATSVATTASTLAKVAPTTTAWNPPSTAAPATTAAPPVTAAPAATAAQAAAASPVAINFTFAPAGGGRLQNPYVAVWIEDANGALVDVVGLWVRTSHLRYLNELRRFYQVANASIDNAVSTISAATRAPGAYAVSWNGKNGAGAAVPAGTYYVCIEAAREHGPYELIREPFTIGDGAFTKALADSGELTGASVSLGG